MIAKGTASITVSWSLVAMTESELVEVCNLINRGGKLYVGRDHAGRQKLKIVHGPFGLMTHRYRCSYEEFEHLKQRLSKRQASPSHA
jgi:hypothetical protein